MSSPNVKDRRQEEGKIWRNALVASLLFHFLVFVVSGRRSVPASAETAAGPAAADLRDVHSGMQAMAISIPRRAAHAARHSDTDGHRHRTGGSG